jgi:hypothetical protein
MAGQDRQDSSQGLIALTLFLNPAPAGFFVSGRGAKNAALKKENHHKQGLSPPATQITLSAKGLIFFFASTIVLPILKFTEKNLHDFYQSRPLPHCLLSAVGRRTRSGRRRRYERAAADRVKQNKQPSLTPAGANRRGFCFGACRLSHQPQGVLHE